MNPSSRQQSEREKALRRYFRRLPEQPTYQESRWSMWGGGALVILGLLFWLGASSLMSRLLLGGVFLGGGALLIYKGAVRYLSDQYRYEKLLAAAFPKPSDKEVDQWLEDGLGRLRLQSLDKLGLTKEEDDGTEELPPIVAPVMWYKKGLCDEDIVSAVGRDGTGRFGIYGITYFWLAEGHLGIFQCDYDLIRDVIVNEEALEFFYQDISSIETRTESTSLTLPTGQSLTIKQELHISVSNARYFTVTVGSEELKRLTGAETIPDNGAERAVRTIRKKLQTAKSGLLSR